LQQLYSRLPIALQHACATAQGTIYYWTRYGAVFPEYLAFLRRTEYLPAEQLRELQTAESQRLLRFVCRNVPYYRNHGSTGLTHKAQIQECLGDFLAETFLRRALLPGHTSGTTGKPLTIFYNREALRKMWAFVELYRNNACVTKDDRRG
jgi:phenylacetate-CoA ligase